MKAAILGGAALALLAGDCVAQGMLDGASGAAPSASTRSQYTPPPKPAPRQQAAATGGQPTTSTIIFHSRPPGAKITLSDGKSCVAPCKFVVGFNEKFTAVATKRGYQAQEIVVAPSVTNVGKAQIIGSAIGAGVIGLVVGAAMADRAYGPEPFVVDLVADAGGGSSYTTASVSPASTSTPAARARTAGSAAPHAAQAAPATAAQTICTPRGCEQVKPGCRIEQPDLSSGSAIGGQSAVIVCR